MSLVKAAVKSGTITMAGQGTSTLVQVVSLFTLSRMLTPEDFGVYAIIYIFFAFGETVRDFGISTAAIQADRVTQQQKSNLLWINVVIGIVLALALAVSGGFWAKVFSNQDVRLPLMFIGILFVVNGFQAQVQVELVRSLKFGCIAVSSVLAQIVGLLLAITLANWGWSYWSLVIQLGSNVVVMTVIRVWYLKWLPSLPRKTPGMGAFLTYGGFLSLAQILTFFSSKVDSFIIGQALGSHPLGVYNRGYQLVVVPSNQLISPLTNLAVTILTRVREDSAQFAKYLGTAQKLLGYSNAWLMSIIVVLAEPVVRIALGDQWGEAVPIVRILGCAVVVQLLSSISYWGFLTYSKTRELLYYNIVTKLATIVLIILGSSWGIAGVAMAFGISLVLSWPVNVAWLARSIEGFRWRTILRGGIGIVLYFIGTTLLSLIIAQLLGSDSDLLAVLTAIAVSTVAACLFIAAFERSFFCDSRLLIAQFRRPRRST